MTRDFSKLCAFPLSEREEWNINPKVFPYLIYFIGQLDLTDKSFKYYEL
ncbi:MAG: hypothetical protein Q4P29_04010 [Tissierellia bacterium]|nr:hypothetical protein [Tissierellia bacterium]